MQVYWHVITNSDCSKGPCLGFLSSAIIRNNIAVLNKAFAGGYDGETC